MFTSLNSVVAQRIARRRCHAAPEQNKKSCLGSTDPEADLAQEMHGPATGPTEPVDMSASDT
jgi:hypothetical protein